MLQVFTSDQCKVIYTKSHNWASSWFLYSYFFFVDENNQIMSYKYAYNSQ